MTSTSAVRNWLEMPDEIMGGMIFQRLNAVEILTSIQKVCTTWRRICKDPEIWKIVDLDFSSNDAYTNYDLEKLSKQAVHRSCGELIDIRLKGFGTDDLLDFISGCSGKLTRLRLTACSGIRGHGLTNALKRLPHLETLKLSNINIYGVDIEVIGHNCPQLKSFTMKTYFMNRIRQLQPLGDVQAIAISMPILRHLKLVGSIIDDDDEVRAILKGCPQLESLDIRGCFNLHLDRNLEKLCKERIKDFKFERGNILEGDEDSEFDFNGYGIDDFYD